MSSEKTSRISQTNQSCKTWVVILQKASFTKFNIFSLKQCCGLSLESSWWAYYSDVLTIMWPDAVYQNVFIRMFMNWIMHTSQGPSQCQRSQQPEQDQDDFLPRLSAPSGKGGQQTFFWSHNFSPGNSMQTTWQHFRNFWQFVVLNWFTNFCGRHLWCWY